MTTLQVAHKYLGRGWRPIPIPFKEKKAIIEGWPVLRLQEEDLPKHFGSGPMNIGILLGEPSGWLVDVDLDDPWAVKLAPRFLPETAAVFGRASKPSSHWLYVCRGVKTNKWKDPNKAPNDERGVILELRSTGCQTVFPGSVHLSGEEIGWDSEGEPAEVAKEVLLYACGKTAAAALLARHWPDPGTRQEAALALAGGLLSGGWAEEATREFILAVAEAAGDEEAAKRAETVRHTAEKLENGDPTTGWPRLAELVGEKTVEKAREWLGIRKKAALSAEAPYIERGNCVYYVRYTAKGEENLERLSNFTARIVRDVERDDGVEQTRVFEIEGRLADGRPLPRISVPALQFMGMNWVAKWGAPTVLAAGFGARDRLREAIQVFSQEQVIQERIYTHLGWRRFGGEWVYLHAGGAIGAEGIQVDPESEALRRYSLTEGDPLEGMRASLRLLEIAPPEMVLPLWAAVWRAPVACLLYPTFVLWLYGPTGSLKSSVLAVFLSHFGGPFSKDSLPESWVSTENVLERGLSLARDVLFAIDDYAPQHHPREAAAMERTVTRIVRQVGNRQARGRLRSDLTIRPEYPPNAMAVSTGEQVPVAVSSIAARILVVPFVREKVDLDLLSQVQGEARRLPGAMRGFIEWLRPRMNDLAKELPQRFDILRAGASRVGGHLRLAEEVAHLYLGTELGTAYAIELGVLSEVEAQRLRDTSWDVFIALAREHAQTLEEERPALRFLHVMDAIFTQGLGHLRDRLTGERPSPIEYGGRSFGWGGESPGGDLLGWVDSEALYLIPDAIWRSVNEYLRSSGGFPVRERTLYDLLLREGILVPGEGGRHTCKPWIEGAARRVLKLKLLSLPSLSEAGRTGRDGANSETTRDSSSPISGEERGGFGEGTRDETAASPLPPQSSPSSGEAQTLGRQGLEGRLPDLPAFAEIGEDKKGKDDIPPSVPCRACHETAWWRGDGGLWICGVCHPPAAKTKGEPSSPSSPSADTTGLGRVTQKSQEASTSSPSSPLSSPLKPAPALDSVDGDDGDAKNLPVPPEEAEALGEETRNPATRKPRGKEDPSPLPVGWEEIVV